jgi:hypothetical protein
MHSYAQQNLGHFFPHVVTENCFQFALTWVLSFIINNEVIIFYSPRFLRQSEIDCACNSIFVISLFVINCILLFVLHTYPRLFKDVHALVKALLDKIF